MAANEGHVLRAIAGGHTLKVHRTLDGEKVYRLHPLHEGEAETIEGRVVEALREKGLIDSNKKFPAATYLLTEKGRAAALALTQAAGEDADDLPLTARGWLDEG